MKQLVWAGWVVTIACASPEAGPNVDESDASMDLSTRREPTSTEDAAPPGTMDEEASDSSVSNGDDASHGDLHTNTTEGTDWQSTLPASNPDAGGHGGTQSGTFAAQLDATTPAPDDLAVVTFTFEGEVYLVRADGSAPPENVSQHIERSGGADRWLVPSPSGRVFALSSARADDEPEILVRANSDFSVITPVLAGGSPVYLEGMPAIVDGGDVIVFSASGGTHARDLFVTREANGEWSQPEELTTNSTEGYNNQPSLTRDQTAVFFNCGREPDPETGGNRACRVGIDGGPVEVVASFDTLANNRNDYVNFPREISGGLVFESAWPQGEQSPETIWQTLNGVTTPAVSRTFDNSVSPCVLPDDSMVLLWLGRPGGDGSHELTRVYADGTFVVLWEGVDVADIGIGCTSRQ